MTTIVITEKNYQTSLRKAANLLTVGGVVIAKADTSYALLILPRFIGNHKILSKIKSNRQKKQYSFYVSSKEKLIKEIKNEFKDLAAKLVPGKVTIVYDNDKPALRYIEAKTILDLIEATKSPLTATSANPSGKEPARDLETIENYFSDYPLIVLYEGVVRKQRPSTVIDLSGLRPKILRRGPVSLPKRVK